MFKSSFITFFLLAVSIIEFEDTVNKFQTDDVFFCIIEEVSETVEKENAISIDEEIMYPYSMYKDVLEGINFTSEKTITTIYNISREILQPPR